MELVDASGPDPLDSLEDRIRRITDLVPQLRQERNEAIAERDAAVRDADKARSLMEELAGEIQSLRAERDQVRTRIEKLLGAMDTLKAG